MAVIGVDVDGTLATGEYISPDVIGPPDYALVYMLEGLRERGHIICAWSCRADYIVSEWLRKYEIDEIFSFVNESPLASDSAKSSFDYYIGDEAIQWPLIAPLPPILVSRAPHNVRRDRGFSTHAPKPYLAGVGRAYVDMFEDHWRAAWANHEFTKKIAFLTICSHAKPYSKSHIHSSIRASLYHCGALEHVDYIHISNAGIIPSEAEMVYPFNAYDWDGTLCDEATRQYHVAAIERRLASWFTAYGNNYERVVIYLREGGNTIGAARAVLAPETKVTIVAGDPSKALPYVAMADPDDCLAHELNLRELRNTFFEY